MDPTAATFVAIWCLLFLVFTAVVVYRPFLGILALAVAIPLRTMLPTFGPVSVPWLVGVFAVVGLLARFLRDRRFTSTPLDVPIALLLLANAISILHTTVDPSALRNFLSVAAAYATYFLTTNLVDDRRQYETVVSALMIVGTFHALVTFYFLLTGDVPFFVSVERIGRVANAGPAGRFWGALGSPSTTSMFFLFLTPLATGRAILSENRLRRAVYVCVVVAFTTSILTTQTRSALLGLMIVTGVLVIGFVNGGALRARTAIGGTVASLVPVVAVLSVTNYLQRFATRFAVGDSFWGGRLDRFYHAIEVGLTNPLGVGRDPALSEALAQAGAANPKKVHNVVLGLFAQTGYAGLAGILWLIVAQLRTNLSLLVDERYSWGDRITLLSVFAGITGYWVMAMFAFKHDWGFVFLYFGMNVAYARLVIDDTSAIGEDSRADSEVDPE